MRLRDSMGLNLSPFILRIVLGVVFVYAGAMKFFSDMPYTPEQTARLAQMGVNIPGQPPAPPAGADLPDADVPAVEADAPVVDGPDTAASPDSEAADGEAAAAEQPPATPAEMLYPNGAELKVVYSVALMIDGAAHPGFDSDGNQLKPIWPVAAAQGEWAVWLALAAGVTELVAGILMFAGFFTRIAAFSLACVMATAMWLTQFGPAIQSGDAVLGFLPDHDLFDGMAWQMLMQQFILLGVALAVVFLGAGALSIDAIIFGAPGDRMPRRPRGERDE